MTITPTVIPGLLKVSTPVHTDNRGWFKEAWQRERMVSEGLPNFAPVQANIAHNGEAGVTRGLHAEPWDKLVSVTSGRAFAAWVDLRDGPGFGRVVTATLDPSTAYFVPRGIANGYQTLEPNTDYAYLVSRHWSPTARANYSYVNLADPALGIAWPLGLETAIVSAADTAHPPLAEISPVPTFRAAVLGAGGQLGSALQRAIPGAVALDRSTCDIVSADFDEAIDFDAIDTVINAAAMTAVDAAELGAGRAAAWATNAAAVGRLAQACSRHGVRLIHVSSDYVYDGTVTEHDEAESPAPLSVYGLTKAAGDLAARQCPRHVIVRPSWVYGSDQGFVRIMTRLARDGASPSVVNDQWGRLTHVDDLAAAIRHLASLDEATGVYHVSNTGPSQSWCDVARDIFAWHSRPRSDVRGVSSEDYGRGKALAPRPRHSTLNLDRLTSSGFTPRPSAEALADYLGR